MAHRKVDVDFDDEDNYEEEILGTSTPSITAAEAEQTSNARAQEVRYLLQRYMNLFILVRWSGRQSI